MVEWTRLRLYHSRALGRNLQHQNLHFSWKRCLTFGFVVFGQESRRSLDTESVFDVSARGQRLEAISMVAEALLEPVNNLLWLLARLETCARHCALRRSPVAPSRYRINTRYGKRDR
jgi:hypothetical protein